VEVTTLPKAAAHGYSPEPFFFRDQDHPEGNRWVAWTGSVDTLKALFCELVGAFPEEIGVVVQIRQWFGEQGQETWQRFQGTCALDDLLGAIQDYEDVVFGDGGTGLAVGCGAEYVVLDDHGLIFVHSDNGGFAPFFRRFGLVERRQSLISEQPHFHSESSDVTDRRRQLLEQLRLHKAC
jgi:hypothetical protein